MKINRIEIKNFYSIKDIKLNFDNFNGIVIIEGKNKDIGGSNGSGKSSIVEAIVWGIFGRTIRKSTEEALINVYENKNCSVDITLNNNIVIRRSKKPTSLKFFVGEEDKTQESSTKTQELIESILNTNYKTFLASTVFGQHNNVDFIDATPDDKRLIIKNFLNLDEIFNKRDAVKDLKSKYNNDTKTMDALIQDSKESLNKIENNLEKLVIGEQKFFADHGVTEDSLVKYSLAEILKIEEDITLQKSILENTNFKINSLETNISFKQKKLTSFKENKTVTCKTCGVSSKATASKKEILELEDEIKDNNVELSRLENKKEKIQDLIKDLQSTLPIPSNKYKIISDWRDLHSKKEFLLLSKVELVDKIDNLNLEKARVLRNLEIMKFWEKAFSETGLIKYIIRNILNFFNGKVNYYLSYLSNGKFVIKFDEELNEKIYTNGKQLSFISLSGGEKRKISLAVMLGLQSLLTNTKRDSTNLMFLDEVGENLDQDGLDGLYILLSELKKDKTLFIITHNNYLKSLIDNCRVLTVTKQNGLSYLSRRSQ
jgi:DNA repair exonuclease SbcCD ATPase subunit